MKLNTIATARICEWRWSFARLAAASGLLAIAATFGGLIGGSGVAEAKTPGKTYCFRGYCRRVKTIAETRREIGRRRSLIASFYDSCRRDRFNPCGLTSSGERFQPHKANNAASPIYPDGTLLLVWNPSTRRSVVVRVNNAGPYHGRRLLDVSRAAAVRLGFRHRGVARVYVKVLRAPTRAEATYRRNRRYAPAPGFIGIFASIDRALVAAGRSIGGLLTPARATPRRTKLARRKTRQRLRVAGRSTRRRIVRRGLRRTTRSTRTVSRRSRTRLTNRRGTKRWRVARRSNRTVRQTRGRRSGRPYRTSRRGTGNVTRQQWLRAGRGNTGSKRTRTRRVRSTRLSRRRRES